MAERLPSHLDSMKRAATNAISFMDGMSLDKFLLDAKTQAATAMCLIVIGEAANSLALGAPDFVDAHPDWSWDKIRGLRNRIAHGYDTLELPIIWSTVTDYLPALLSAIETVGELDPRLTPKD